MNYNREHRTIVRQLRKLGIAQPTIRWLRYDTDVEHAELFPLGKTWVLRGRSRGEDFTYLCVNSSTRKYLEVDPPDKRDGKRIANVLRDHGYRKIKYPI